MSIQIVETDIGPLHVTISGENRGRIWAEDAVLINRIPYKVEGDWTRNAEGRAYISGYGSFRRLDKTGYGEDHPTDGAREKVYAAIQAAIDEVAKRPDFLHVGRLALISDTIRANEYQIKRFEDQIADLQKQIKAHVQQNDVLEDAKAFIAQAGPAAFEAQVERCRAKGAEQATEDIARVGGDDANWSAVYGIEREVEAKLRQLEREVPVAHLARSTDVAYYQGYLKVCSDVREISRLREYANR